MNIKTSKHILNYFGSILKAYNYIPEFYFGITDNNNDKIEFSFNNHDVIVVHIPTKGFQCYVDNGDIGIFKHWEEFKDYMIKL